MDSDVTPNNGQLNEEDLFMQDELGLDPLDGEPLNEGMPLADGSLYEPKS